MCSSGFLKDANPVAVVKSINEERRKLIGGLDKKLTGGRTFSEMVGTNTKESTLRKGYATQQPSVEGSGTRLAVGTQVGRKPLGSTEPTAGLNI